MSSEPQSWPELAKAKRDARLEPDDARDRTCPASRVKLNGVFETKGMLQPTHPPPMTSSASTAAAKIAL